MRASIRREDAPFHRTEPIRKPGSHPVNNEVIGPVPRDVTIACVSKPYKRLHAVHIVMDLLLHRVQAADVGVALDFE